ncbi:hypothetical protein CO174_02540 [Candidatus Uhrbacteria bacterium CG_4_9_14_3_um_filter_50_9]|uniref:Uncharacterized protein n=1 Tax=Candidatus Uhrbacteria bacterium CG_4_9_14_3_um_filter_50_9 TaxID=1975035 RepID=A0A2M7XCH5_9BACT|nr:MAG: hypothetical protein CO174_02540 [Candidatus Uhrbacteria bacterium CG_4_9_14_3_um_filter_50_9]
MAIVAEQRHAIETLLESIPTDVLNHCRSLKGKTLREITSPEGLPLRFLGVSRGIGHNSARRESVGVFAIDRGHSHARKIEIPAEEIQLCEAFVLVRDAEARERSGHILESSALQAVQLLDVVRFGDRQEAGIVSFELVPNHVELYVAC